ncbi:hypothetical protein CBS115989_1286 [Aspergillus niger]|uniref:Large ribosomal subunit protein mL40 n=2 Tax=Aspergillus TaxID=5052 RepID=A0A370PQV0_ASPPH|nr:hypothetical protein ANI_1_598144 [Aspergillus niger CBS 513.88]XP_025459588.1 uncharacterized protein BO96DRAFT_408340 [Aspergillus niger CBS 101883]KAI2823697.1 hypothetical protein CBS115989_1286 [Aspergillus niger]RDH21691.1 hypothetical protein M747DRAFT_330645 [Aspergillus niger ATCC 13496]RDK44560.1 hypothetical protein M752DRAFT_325507 [Aspergillus phoenicis ATCC 13157]KAI2829684.1 hypothetical protein CBS133816_4113 [Aspergillus niger]KAI2838152.1 hypothetical protein CBS11350_836|eukprot:XP_003188940.1 hypothetical protein ANI_1_598144 [Aspergillus niger CBS 513.88]
MRTLSPVLASLASVFRIPMTRPTLTSNTITNTLRQSQLQPQSQFSTTISLQKRKESGFRGDRRITLIRYFLHHPLTPRPLRFSRTRFLRHWTIHRAWNLYQGQQRRKHELELQRQWQAMQAACEELRTGAGDGGKLFRKSMIKTGVFRDLVPIEYARLQTEGPSREGWNHEWKRD